MFEKIRSPWEIAGVPPETPVLLALSGGADSRALLHLLAERAKKEGFPLSVAHVNHGIRGEESLRDREFCRRLADQSGAAFHVLDVDVPALAAAHGTGIEEEARTVRYEFFFRVMRENSIPLLVTAHHADDQAETVLFRLSRGCGLRGLCGILPVRAVPGGTLVRPLLEVPKREILHYCEENGLTYLTDSTNSDLSIARNRVRARVLPELEALFPDPQSRIARTVDALREDEAYLSGEALRLSGRAKRGDNLSLPVLAAAPLPLLYRVLILWLEEQTGATPERVHLDALTDLILGRTPTARVALPRGFAAAAERGVLTLSETGEHPSFDGIPVTAGETVLPGSGIRITVQRTDRPALSGRCADRFPVAEGDLTERGFFWRSRREGDLLLSGGMHRRLRRLWREAGVPVYLRGDLPLLCDRDGIVWAPFAGARDGSLPAPGSACYEITLSFPDGNAGEDR